MKHGEEGITDLVLTEQFYCKLENCDYNFCKESGHPGGPF